MLRPVNGDGETLSSSFSTLVRDQGQTGHEHTRARRAYKLGYVFFTQALPILFYVYW